MIYFHFKNSTDTHRYLIMVELLHHVIQYCDMKKKNALPNLVTVERRGFLMCLLTHQSFSCSK